jgi:hypothetical protein
VLLRNLGTRPVNRRVLGVPLVAVGVAAAFYLRSIPTAGNDVAMEFAGGTAGLVLGVLATATTRITRHADRRVTIHAGFWFAAIWVAAIGGRIAFAELATHAWAPAVARFSIAHQITGADAWRTTFVLMAVAMVLGRVASTVIRIAHTPAAAGAAIVTAPTTA